MVDGGPTGPSHSHVRDLPALLDPGDLLVVNTTKVLPARVPVERPGGGSGEILLLEDRSTGWWEALCRPSRKLPPGVAVHSTGGALRFEMGEDLGDGRRLVRPIPTTGSQMGHDESALWGHSPRTGRCRFRRTSMSRLPIQSATRPPTPNVLVPPRLPQRGCT
ncbi:MAG: S-adenosylmethionine:tRNA ribosyltransferase-isomerase [Microthrixaceae bacterium]|nr:S-adenosylmethionine:tRNA ribosyltransferase-isomerase [Microthrixaceae bacterium]